MDQYISEMLNHINELGIAISNPQKILFPKTSITKLELVKYYWHIAPYMLPYLQNRPIVLQRYPDGIHAESFFQKNTADYFPAWIKTVTVPKKEGGYTQYVVCQNRKTLIYLVNLATITFHLWLSSLPYLEQPDRLIFDLDPSPDVPFSQVIQLAYALRDILQSLGLKPYVMTTGSKGLHIALALNTNLSYQETRDFAKGCAYLLVHKYPKLATLEISKDKRQGKVFIDTLRNQFGALAVAPYSVRPLEKAPVATPLDWKELRTPNITSQQYTITTILNRLKTIDDPWKDFLTNKQRLEKPLQQLYALLK